MILRLAVKIQLLRVIGEESVSKVPCPFFRGKLTAARKKSARKTRAKR